MSGDPEQEYFADGMTEDLITDLSKVSGLSVIARNSVFTYKGKSADVQEVSRRFGVATVLEGSVRKAGQRVRINAQLIDGKDGTHLWADRYDRDLTDIFALQDEITRTIVDQLKVRLLPAGEAGDRGGARRTTSTPTTITCRAGTSTTSTRRRTRGLRSGCSARRSSSTRAMHAPMPGWPIAPGSCSPTTSEDATADEITGGEHDGAAARSDACRGLCLARHGAASFGAQRRGDGRVRQGDRARPESVRGLLSLRLCLPRLGRHGGRRAHVRASGRACAERFPHGLDAGADAARSRPAGRVAGRLPGSASSAPSGRWPRIPTFRCRLRLAPPRWPRLGERPQALEWAARALLIAPDDPLTQYNVACVYALLAEHEQAIDLLERWSANTNKVTRKWLVNDSDFDGMRQHPRFQRAAEPRPSWAIPQCRVPGA